LECAFISSGNVLHSNVSQYGAPMEQEESGEKSGSNLVAKSRWKLLAKVKKIVLETLKSTHVIK